MFVCDVKGNSVINEKTWQCTPDMSCHSYFNSTFCYCFALASRNALRISDRFSALYEVYKVSCHDGVHVLSASRYGERVTANKLDNNLHASDKEYSSSMRDI
jgi:hypothetical protein